jgi:biopolymer transport protein ExbD
MAELNVSAGANRHKGAVRSKKLSTRVDLTPMVDLGFLLITFFVFTTTVSEPKAMELYMPAGKESDFPIGKSTALTIIPIANSKIFYYHGDLYTAEQEGLYGITNFSVNDGIGDVIRKKQQALDASGQFKRSDLMLIIRPAMDASYKNVVDALDEVLINDVKHYSFVDLTAEEKTFLDKHSIK